MNISTQGDKESTSVMFLCLLRMMDCTKATDIEGLRDTGRSIMDSFHEHKKAYIKHGLVYEDLKIYMEDFSRQLSKAFSALETKAAEETAEGPAKYPVQGCGGV